MQAIKVNGLTLHVDDRGPTDGPALVFSNSLGTDFRIWDPLLPHLPSSLRVIRYDKRGHGLSDLAETPFGMEANVSDLAGILDQLGVTRAVICGLSVGGMIAQGLAAARPDLVPAMILCDTGAKIGTPDLWNTRISMARSQGLEEMADGVMERWFTSEFRANDPGFALWRSMLCRTPGEGYAAMSTAIRDTDLTEQTSALRIPCLAVCGDKDGATPPDLVRETAGLIRGSRFELIRDAGHIPCVEQPEALGALITDFLSETGVVPS